ncbi:hypothetical protein VNO77_22554 [Canavalia gladiata]|uniref:Uncharacterized protein n=1 Tax=Canavalia gladiata TaxID=3824 RepID=A0AAN9L814_CANGL
MANEMLIRGEAWLKNSDQTLSASACTKGKEICQVSEAPFSENSWILRSFLNLLLHFSDISTLLTLHRISSSLQFRLEKASCAIM